jgi:MFS family permease
MKQFSWISLTILEIKNLKIEPAKVLLPLGLGTALSLMGDATLYTVLPTHTEQVGISLAAVGILLSANRFIRLFLNNPTGIAFDRSLRRRLFVPALMIGALSTAIYAGTHGFWPLLAGRLLWGIAWSGIWIGGATIIMDITNHENRGRWIGLYQTWFFLGTSLGAIIGGWLTDIWGFSIAMWVGAGLTALGALFAYFTLPETKLLKDEINESNHKNKTVKWQPGFEFYSVITINGINRFITAGVIAATLALLVNNQLPRTNIVLGVASVTGLLAGFRTILSMFSAPLSGIISDKNGSRWGVVISALVLGAIGMLLLISNHTIIIMFGISLSAIASGSLQSLMTARTGDIVVHAHQGKAIGTLQTAGDLGSALGPVIAYALLAWITLSGLYVICAILFGIGLILAALNHRSRGFEEQLAN